MDNQIIQQYQAYVKVGNISTEKDGDALSLMQEELSMRPHLLSFNFERTDKAKKHDMCFVIKYFGVDASSVNEQISEEILEIGSAILNYIEGVTVEVQGIELI